MGLAFEEQLQSLEIEYRKALQLLSLPQSVLESLDRIPESEEDRRASFIREKIESQLVNLKDTEYCIIPSIISPRNFTFVIKTGETLKKITGALKVDHIEIHPQFDTLIKTKNLKECIERVILSFEKQAAIPILYENHRDEVEINARKILDACIENNNISKMKALFKYTHFKEIEENSLYAAFAKSSKEIIDFLIEKLNNKEIRFRQIESRISNNKEKFEQILLYARKRSAKGGKNNSEIAHIILNYLANQFPERLTEKVLLTENKIADFFRLMIELSQQKPQEDNFLEKRNLLEEKIVSLLKQMGENRNSALNIKIGDGNVFALDVALMKGSPHFIAQLLQMNAAPTVGWKYESLENFKNNQRSVLRYILSRSQRSGTELNDIVKIIENFLKVRETKVAEESTRQVAQGTFQLLQELLDKEETPPSPPKKDKP